MYYFAKDITRILNGTLHGNGNPDAVIRHLLIDSRSLASAETSLFFALKGERHDGHKFIADAYKKRVRNFVVSELPSPLGEATVGWEQSSGGEGFKDANFILVKDTLSALQHLCANHRKKFNIPVLGITGSNGKTIVKEWLYQLIQEDKNIVRSPKSYNSQVGVPLSVWLMSEENNLAIFGVVLIIPYVQFLPEKELWQIRLYLLHFLYQIVIPFLALHQT